jgi:cephalosporin-C deacetylase-like acetyl esterase
MKKLLFILFYFLSLSSFAQKEFRILDWKTEYTLNNHLIQQMLGQYDHRMEALQQALSSKQNLQSYIKSVRDKFITLLGDRPPLSPLNARITGTLSRDGYRIEKVVYESFAQHHVTTNLYIPDGRGPFPAVLLFCGHEDVSKATESYQKTAILFAKNGFVVFVIDPISQSERHQLTDAAGKPLTRGGTTEHTLINASSNIVGTSAAAYELWDNVRALDYLVTRSEVDTARIGCAGNSGGGMQTIYFAAYDQRIKVIAPCSYLASRERTLELSGPPDGCATIPGEGAMELEMVDYLIAAAPKPVLVLAGRFDFIDYNSTLFAFNDLKQAYSVLGEPGKAQLFVYDDGHGISQPKRAAVVDWFKRWLMRSSPLIKETPEKVSTDKELFATASGQVNIEYKNEVTIFERNKTLADSFAASRESFKKLPKADQLEKIKELLGITLNNEGIGAEDAGEFTKNNIRFQKFIVRKHNEVPIPVLVVYPAKIKKVVAWFHSEGKHVIADSAALIRKYMEEGTALVIPDVRGIGELEDKAELNDPKYYNKEYRNAMIALHIGKPLVGQRAADILTIIQFIESDEKLKDAPAEIHAQGILCLSALHAALFNEKVAHVTIYDSILSFESILENPLQKNSYSLVVPGVLKYYDFASLVAKVNRVSIVFPLNLSHKQNH